MSRFTAPLAALLSLLVAAVAPAADGELPSERSPILEAYVTEALESNLALAQREIDVERSLEALAEARALFRPTVGLVARSSRAGGGRDIEFPVGDLLNPVYGTLNELLVAGGEAPRFGTIENVSIPFLREEEQDTRFRLFQPIYRPELRPNLRLQRALADASALSMDTFRRELIRDVKVAYFDWLRAQRFVEIAESTRELVAENLRVNRAQYENGRLTRDEVLRLEAELAAVEQEQLDVERQALLAQSFFNFLLNRSLDAPIDVDAALLESLEEQDGQQPLLHESTAMDLAIEKREELAELDAAESAAEAGIALARAGLRPALDLVADYGIEGVEYRVQSDADFWQASLLLEWTFWDSGQTRARRRQAELEAERVRTQRAEVEQQLRLEVRDSWRRLEVARRSVSVARERLRSATEAYRIVERRYEGGVVPQVSLIDARSELTRARVGLTTSYFEMLARDAELERVVAEVELPPLNPSLADSSDTRR